MFRKDSESVLREKKNISLFRDKKEESNYLHDNCGIFLRYCVERNTRFSRIFNLKKSPFAIEKKEL